MKKVPVEDKAQEKGESAQVQSENEFRSKFQEAIAGDGNKMERIATVFEKYPEFRDEYLGDEQGFLTKYGTAPESEDASSEEEIKAPEEGWIESGKKESKSDGELEKLRAEFDEKLKKSNEALEAVKRDAEKKIAEAASEAVKPKAKVEEIEIPEDDPILPEDLDLLTDEGQSKLKEWGGKLGQHNAKLKKALKSAIDSAAEFRRIAEELKGKVGSIETVKTDVDSLRQEDAKSKAKEQADNRMENEFAEIDKIVRAKENQDVFGEIKRSVREIESDHMQFLRDLLDVAGEKVELLNPDGTYSREAIDLLALYNDEQSKKGKDFRALCEREKVAPPSDYDVLDKVYQIRNYRATRAGNYNDALLIWKGENLNRFRVQDRLSQRQARDRAVENRKRFAKETKAEDPVEAVDLTQLSTRDFEKLMSIPIDKRSPDQKRVLRSIFEQKGFPEHEIRYYVDGEEGES